MERGRGRLLCLSSCLPPNANSDPLLMDSLRSTRERASIIANTPPALSRLVSHRNETTHKTAFFDKLAILCDFAIRADETLVFQIIAFHPSYWIINNDPVEDRSRSLSFYTFNLSPFDDGWRLRSKLWFEGLRGKFVGSFGVLNTD